MFNFDEDMVITIVAIVNITDTNWIINKECFVLLCRLISTFNQEIVSSVIIYYKRPTFKK